MTNTIPVPVESVKVLAEFFEHENPHHLVVKAVFAGKELRALLDKSYIVCPKGIHCCDESCECKGNGSIPLMATRPAGQCAYPPDGWSCSRETGHDGPCAASPVEAPKVPVVTMRTVMLAMESASAARFITGTSNWCAHVAQKLNAGFPEQVKVQGHCCNGDHCLCGGDTAGVRAQCDNWIKP